MFISLYFIRFSQRNRRHSWRVGQWRREGMQGRIVKVEKKMRKGVTRIGKKKKNVRPYTESSTESEKKRCKNLTWAPAIVWKRKNPSPFRSCLECSHKMEMKDREKGTLVQRKRYPLLSRSLQYWPMNRCVRNTTYGVQYLKIFLIIFLL